MTYFILMNVGSPLILTDYSLQNWALIHSSDRIFSCFTNTPAMGLFSSVATSISFPKVKWLESEAEQSHSLMLMLQMQRAGSQISCSPSVSDA